MTTRPAPVLSLAGIAKAYGGKPALKGVSLEVRPGETVGLLGPNGAGKSTLFQICAGLFAADAGIVEVFGQRYRHAASAIHARLGVVFQARSLDAEITGRANLRFHGGLFGLRGAALRARIEDVAAGLGIVQLLDRPVRELSGGNQRRVEIARALLSGPELLLLDEPSTGLDAAARRHLVGQLRRLGAERGTALLWATHLCDEVEGADRIVLLARGEVVGVGSPAELIETAGARDLTDASIAICGAASRLPPAAYSGLSGVIGAGAAPKLSCDGSKR